ncbi:hypothetical protein [Zunongwangia pacifica]|uniref:Uncharacterized protein n=1 Tax=Zunongwangia pacifica TaxID=2911062 RepID=A0A9X1ZPH9_9FLAO|nr:hypothetical protein [Zunongwangia pacifica]MCL6218592.1 hypothetical protein [Zunongwangia pacifica]
MATDLHIVSNSRSFSKVQIEQLKDEILEKLKSLNLEPIVVIGVGKLEGDWSYEFPEYYNAELDLFEPDENAQELISFNSPFVFNIRVYENCIELITIYKYRFLYEDEKIDNFNQFRKNIYDIISIFGGTEIIYLADNSCNKLSDYLELRLWEQGASYEDIKQEIINKELPFVSDYGRLKLNNLNYRSIKEVVFDEFKDI